uniref:Uncharacterized protein n=1 Tax=Trypanosoma vivax (strain Y486) TaxID=1055687 RepID=G0TSS0_TRYVY|nr:hypothetical protein TVY486_0301850 [Trypanosoma vivax Y486]
MLPISQTTVFLCSISLRHVVKFFQPVFTNVPPVIFLTWAHLVGPLVLLLWCVVLFCPRLFRTYSRSSLLIVVAATSYSHVPFYDFSCPVKCDKLYRSDRVLFFKWADAPR